MNPMLDLLITNATSTTDCHIGIRDGRVVVPHDRAAPVGVLPAARRSIDTADRVVIPGGVDEHCHIQQVTGSWSSLADFTTATIAALWGGTTTGIDFGIPADRGKSPLEAAENKMRPAEAARWDVALHGAVTAWDHSVPWQRERLAVADGNLHMDTDFSPFGGLALAGWLSVAVCAGQVVLEDGVFADPGPTGRFIHRLGIREATATGAGSDN
ncbi:hypothetical protein [Modestobacter sp. I12A-02662]|uniref:hypothetical protein n=1 Tax=Modestobacter sp. I12A-02662 TaxID=1730496 RepID=UPI0034DFAAD5